eukprot:COSAG01_NODE_6235_length_3776_cov_48.658961_7_plen_388_part_00
MPFGGLMRARQRLCYSVGHAHNDLSASLWFSYLLVYLHSVARLSSAYTGLVYLIGHVVDALCTPLVGVLSDRTTWAYGRRKSWHLIGSAAAQLSLPFVYADPCTTFRTFLRRGHDSSSNSCWSARTKLLWYAGAVTVFQFGWAAVQTTHLALGRELSEDAAERLQLYSSRYTVGILMNITVFGGAWALLAWWGGQPPAATASASASAPQVGAADTIGPGDATPFLLLALGAAGLGLLAQLAFHVGVREPGGGGGGGAGGARQRRRSRRFSEVDAPDAAYRHAARTAQLPPPDDSGLGARAPPPPPPPPPPHVGLWASAEQRSGSLLSDMPLAGLRGRGGAGSWPPPLSHTSTLPSTWKGLPGWSACGWGWVHTGLSLRVRVEIMGSL